LVNLKNQGDKDQFRSPNASISIYKEISKGLGCKFRRFKEIRYNPTEDQEINKKLSPTLSNLFY